MNSIKYGIIGNNWGLKILKILESMDKHAKLIKIKSPKKYNNLEKYKKISKKIIKNISKNFDVIWIAIPSNEKLFLANQCLKNDLNLIIEKPWLYSFKETQRIIKLQKKKKLQIGVHYEYLYLKKLFLEKKIKLFNKKKSNFKGIFNVKSKIGINLSPLYELGSHLMSIKLLYFNKTMIQDFECSYNKKDCREIKLFNNKKMFSLNFTHNKEPIIQRFIIDYEKKLVSKKKYNIDLKFACNVYKNIKYLIDSKK